MARMLRLMLTVLLLCACLSSAPVGAAGQNGDLQQAAEDGNLDRVRALIDNGADVNARDTWGKTALMYAASKDHVDVVRVLLQKGADVNAKTTNSTPEWLNGWTALMYAANHGNCNAVRILLNEGANAKVTADDGQTVLVQATGCRDDIIRALQRTGADLDAKSSTGVTGLMSAALSGDASVVRTFLDKGADVNAKTGDGGTALMVSAVMGHADVMRMLIDRGADVNARDNDGQTALLLAIENASTAEAIRRLVAIGVTIGANPGALGNKPQPTASIVRTLLDNGADVNVGTNEGGTALMYAAQSCDEGIVQMLLDRGAKVNVETNAGVSALMLAKGSGCGKIVRKLRNAGAK
ncbi:MAG: ankyrin repeat domain-containing protein [Bryobacteraceae bacterium]